MKKKILIGILALILMCGTASAALVISTGDSGITQSTRLEFANATELDKYNVAYNLVNQIPDPAEPGKYVELRWKVENFGSKMAENVIVELLPVFPFSLDPGISATQKIGGVWGRQIGEEGVMLFYKVRVDEDAIEGDNQIKLRYSLDNGNSWLNLDPFIVRVRTQDAILAIEDISSTFDTIRPGEISTIKIKLMNMADSLLKDIKVKLDVDDVDLAPVGSTNEKTIKTLKSGEIVTIEFDIMPDPDAECGLCKVPISIDYLDWSGNAYSRENTFGLIIGGKPDLMITIDSSEIKSSSKTGNVVIKFTNKGLTDIKLLNIKLNPSNDYTIISNDEDYIGNIDSDDYETTDFNINVKKTDKEKIPLKLSLEYRDANNNPYTEDIEVDLRLYSKKQAQEFGLEKKSPVAGIIIVIVIVAAGLFFYIRYRKKKAKK